METKELILCALRSNVDKVELFGGGYQIHTTGVGWWGITKHQTFKRVVKVKITKNWWGKETKEEDVISVPTETVYQAAAFKKSYEITEKEFTDFKKYYQQKIEEKQLEQLKNLCSNS